jgi:hypothetical protein
MRICKFYYFTDIAKKEKQKNDRYEKKVKESNHQKAKRTRRKTSFQYIRKNWICLVGRKFY